MATTATATAAASPASTYTPPVIPQTWRESFSAWRTSNRALDSANAELHLYSKTGYFRGAQVGNAPNLAHGEAFASASSGSVPTDVQRAKSLVHLATSGTAVNPKDGKVGVLRAVNIGPAPGSASKGSWLHSGATDSYVNMLEIGTPRKDGAEEVEEEKIVLLHGYGAGTAFFFQNIAQLAAAPVARNGFTGLPTRLFALDWLGMGRSSRPPFHVPQAALKAPPSSNARVHAAENFFVDSLEEWRSRMGIERFTIVGHSLGGYLSVAYALRFPERINRIVLVSPAGSGDNPEDETQNKPVFAPKLNSSSKPVDAEQELRDVQADIAPQSRREAQASAASVKDDVKMHGSSPQKDAGAKADSANQPPRLSPRTRSFFKFLWEQNVSPFGILRGSGFLSPLLTGRYTSRRFGTLGDEDLRALHSYCHAIFTDSGSSEYCLAHILAPGAYARYPLTQRVGALKVPTTFLYGAHDWMDVDGGRKCCKVMEANGNINASTFVVPKSGHHIYLDNPTAFNELMRNILAGKTDKAQSAQPPSRTHDKAGL